MSTSSIARCLPITRASRCVPPPPGMIPRRISGWPSSALSDATIMSQASASSQPPPSAYPDTAAISGVRIAASRGQNPVGRRLEHVLEVTLGHVPDVRARGEPFVAARDHDAAHLGVGVPALEGSRQLLHQLGRERVAGVGAVQRREPTAPSVSVRIGGHQTIAFTPVTDRAMISFWICDVPS